MRRFSFWGALFAGIICSGQSFSLKNWENRHFMVSKGGSVTVTPEGSLYLQYDPTQSKFTEFHFMINVNLGYFERVGVYF